VLEVRPTNDVVNIADTDADVDPVLDVHVDVDVDLVCDSISTL
jgi:hypothetical protein